MSTDKTLTIAYYPASDGGLSFRGTEVALYGYAHHAETLLGHKSIICLKIGAFNEPLVLKHFKARFPIIYFKDASDLESQFMELKVDALYTIRSGKIEEPMLQKIPMLVHCVYTMKYPHGFISAGISKSVAMRAEQVKPFVPHMVYVDDSKDNYRELLGIPDDAIVFGRHGGADTWDLFMARDTIIKVLNECPHIWFIFTTRPNILMNIFHPRLICLEIFTDLEVKKKFINTMDFFLHAQTLGETFGLSLAEASVSGKPVITWNGGKCQEHLQILGSKCILYNTADELYKIIVSSDPKKMADNDWNAYKEYSPELIMRQFDEVFLDPLKRLLNKT